MPPAAQAATGKDKDKQMKSVALKERKRSQKAGGKADSSDMELVSLIEAENTITEEEEVEGNKFLSNYVC